MENLTNRCINIVTRRSLVSFLCDVSGACSSFCPRVDKYAPDFLFLSVADANEEFFEYDAEEFLVFLTLLITEGRTPEYSVKGRTEGLHCPPAQSAMPPLHKHDCNDKLPQVRNHNARPMFVLSVCSSQVRYFQTSANSPNLHEINGGAGAFSEVLSGSHLLLS